MKLIATPGGRRQRREAHMVDEVTEKPPEQVRRRPFPSSRASQPEEETPLQTRCRCSGAVTYRTTTSRSISSLIRHTIRREPKELVTPAPGWAFGRPEDRLRA